MTISSSNETVRLSRKVGEMQPRLARSRLLAKKSSGWFASAEWFMLAVMASIVALGVLVALHHVESSRKVHVQSGMMVFGNTYVVNSTGDGDNDPFIRGCDDGTHHCTLRAAIQQANFHAGTDDITFNIPTSDPGFNNGTWTINLGKALDPLSDPLNITGPGANQLIVQRSTVVGTPQFRIFNLTTTGTVTFSGLTIANGNVIGDGGGIQNVNADTVNITNTTLSRNVASDGSNITSHGAGISNNSIGTINVTNSTLSSNFASFFGGGICNNSTGTVNVTNSTLSSNRAFADAGISNTSTGT